ncbi:MAG: mechanosensitive ion channel domain-containing protein [Myxococcota bacterium]
MGQRARRGAGWPAAWIAALWMGLGLAAPGALAQEPEAAAPAAVPEEPAEPQPIPVAQITSRTDDLQQTLRRLSASIESQPAVTAIESELPELRELGRARLERTDELLAGSPTLEELGDAESEWQGRLSELASRRQMLARRSASLERQVAELEGLEASWTRTLELVRSSDAPPEMAAIVDDNLAAIRKVERGLAGRRSQVLVVLTAVGEREADASAALERIVAERSTLRSRIFEPDAEPLWSAVASRGAISTRAVRANIGGEWRELVDFTTSRLRSLIPLLPAFLAALLLARFVRTRLRRRVADGRLEGTAVAFERPVSVAALLTAFAAAFAFPYAPSLVWEAVGVLLLVPVLRLLVPVVPAATRPILGLMAVFYLVDRVREVLDPAQLLGRSVFVAETAAACAAIGLLLRSSRLGALSDASAPPASVGTGMRLASAALGLAALANTLGYLAFGRLLGDGTLQTIYLALVAYAGYRIGTTLVLVLLTSRDVRRLRVVANHADGLALWSRRAIGGAAALLWALASLEGFAVRDVVVGAVDAVLFTSWEIGALSLSLASVLAFPLTVFLAFAASRAIRGLLEEDVYPRVTLQRGVGNAISTTLHYALVLGGFFLAVGAAGIDLGKFALLAGALGVGIGFGLQNVVNNFVSGLLLLYERPIQVGDTIEIGGLIGDVKQIGIRASTVVTFQGAEVVVPNGDLLSGQLINWTLSDRHRRVEVPVGVAYGNRPADVIPVLQQVLEAEDRMLDTPRPQVLFRGFGDSSLDFELRFWARDYQAYLALASDVASKVYDALEKAGIEIPFPQRDLHIKSMQPEVAENLRRGGRHEHE